MRRPIIIVLPLVALGLAIVTYTAVVSMPRQPPAGIRPSLEGVETGLAASPDGSHLAFAAKEDEEGHRTLYTIRVSDSVVSRLSATPRGSSWPAYSTSGRQIAFSMANENGPGYSIWWLDVATKSIHQITRTPYLDIQPVFARDDEAIVFARARQYRSTSTGGTTWDQWDLHLIRLSDGVETQLTDDRFRMTSRPSISPDGSTLVFGGVLPTSRSAWTLYTMQLGSSSRPVDLVKNTLTLPGAGPNVSFFDPFLAPSGMGLCFTSNLVSRASMFDYEVWQVQIDGTGLSQLTSNQAFNAQPQYLQGENAVVYLSDQKRTGVFEIRCLDLSTGIERIVYPNP